MKQQTKRSRWLQSLVFSIIAGFHYSAHAVPAAPGEHQLEQPDGAVIIAKQWGDEWMHGWETVTGYSIVLDEKSNTWFYAQQDRNGALVASDTPVAEADTSGEARKGRTLAPVYRNGGLIPQHLRLTGSAKAAALARGQSAMRSPANGPALVVPPTGTGQLPVLMINFNDRSTTYTPANFNSSLFGATGKTMRTYYEEVSHSLFTVTGQVLGWYTAANGHDYYGANTGGAGSDIRPGQLVKEAATLADATTDYAPYDTDGDCYVDVVAVIHQGSGEEAGGPATDIWSHRWSLTSATGSAYTTNDACPGGGFIKVNDYIIQPETMGANQQTIGVFAHEYGHSFGLPDLYDTDNSSEGVGNWDLMAGGSWNGVSLGGDTPAHMGAWTKLFLGWVTPTAVSGSMTAEDIQAAYQAADVYQFGTGAPKPTANGQYFLIENRYKSGFDAGLPGSGLLIWHIDEAKKTANNSDNAHECFPPTDCTTTHYRVSVEQADGLWEMEKNIDRGDSADPFVNSATGFTDSTTPSSQWYDGSSSNLSITNISAAGSNMTADFSTATSGNGVLAFTSNSQTLGEGDGSVNLLVSRTGGSTGAISVTCQTANGTALAGNDFTTTSTVLNWDAGDTANKPCAVPILQDTLIEGAQSFSVSLSSPTGGAVLGAPDTATVNITDDETCSATNLNLDGEYFENGANVTCVGTTSLSAPNVDIASGANVTFISPSNSMGNSFHVNGVLTVTTPHSYDLSNSGSISIPALGTATPYPSTLNVAGAVGTVSKVTVTLTGLGHVYPDDMEVLLVGPAGQNVVLVGDAGGSSTITNVNLVFDDAAPANLPDSSLISSGTYKPSAFETQAFTAPAPSAPYGSSLSVFDGTNPNGTWSLYVQDDESPDGGSITGGWSIHIETN